MGARLESIWIAARATAQPRQVEIARAIPGRGLEGDRYANGAGTFTPVPNPNGRDLTLVTAEAVEHLRAASGRDLAPGDLRRNLVVSGLYLRALVGAHLRIGTVLVRVTGTCPPCAHLDRLLELDSLTLLRRRGGVRAAILEGGELRDGAAIRIERAPAVLP
ncbi:MOSC domain protein [Planctomycetes bacterium Pla86]|uniref:MOSC domain protein n=2 Tax=Engelhardtia mirabilis TaxID=2528011 RepID=A0A518BEW2_9BACT|nr:MOSC domain protein [Planctomycetes bacterium Pla133]QDU99850.1 MOSC domain protein [Planctomycetes bacterium Pla86]